MAEAQRDDEQLRLRVDPDQISDARNSLDSSLSRVIVRFKRLARSLKRIHVSRYLSSLSSSLCFVAPVNKRIGDKPTEGSCGESTDGGPLSSVSLFDIRAILCKSTPRSFFFLSSPLCHLKNAWRLWIN